MGSGYHRPQGGYDFWVVEIHWPQEGFDTGLIEYRFLVREEFLQVHSRSAEYLIHVADQVVGFFDVVSAHRYVIHVDVGVDLRSTLCH